MNEIINSCLMALNSIGRGFWGYTAGIFVQSSLLIVLLLLIDLLTRKRVRATFRYWIWMLVFVKLILPPTLCLPTGIGYWCGDYLSSDSSVFKQVSIIAQQESIGIPTMQDFSEPSKVPAINESMDSDGIIISRNSTESAQAPQISPSQTKTETATPVLYESTVLNPITWQAVVFLIWLMGVLVISVLLVQRMSFVKGLIAQSEPSDERLAQVLNQCWRQVNIHRNIELRLSPNISGPAVCGLIKPVILMPAALDGKLSPDKLRAVLIHELAHIKRGDLWINLIQTFLQIIYFYNPFVWIANAVVRNTREQAVDEMVLIALDTEAQNYSNTLIDIAEMAFSRTSLSLRLIGVVESKKALHRRIKIMLNRPVPKSAKLGILGLLVIIIIGAILLPMAKANKADEDAGFLPKMTFEPPEMSLKAKPTYATYEPIELFLSWADNGWIQTIDNRAPENRGKWILFLRVNGVDYFQGELPLLIPEYITAGVVRQGRNFDAREVYSPDAKPIEFTPGRYKVSYIYKDVSAARPDEPQKIVHFGDIATNEVEFEVIDSDVAIDEPNSKASSKLIPVRQQYNSESTKVDIAIEDKDLRVIKLSDRLYQATIILLNKCSVPIPQFRVNFYAGDPDKGGRLLSPQQAGPIMPGDSWGEYNPGLKLRPGETVISVVVDPDNRVEESDETNNKASQSISMIVSESENVYKVEAIQKVDLAGDDILQIEAQEAKGFNFPYYLFVPSGIDKDRQVYILVETNNSGTVSDDLEFHRAKALMLAKRSHANRMARRLGVPLLVPTFPRPKTNWWAYTHALDIDTLEIEEGKLKRIDLQLTAMITHAQELLRINGFAVKDRIFMHGFSASAKFCNRYSFLHPEMVKAAAAGGVNGLPTLPVRQWNGYELPFPIGTAGIERFIDGPFNEKAFGQVAHYIYMGSLDRNDTLPSRDAWREEEADIIKKALAEKMMPDRWELTRKIYHQQKLPAQLVTYNGVTHSIKSEMLDDVIDFFKANSEEKFVRIEPYEYPFVESKEIRPEDRTESAIIDIAVEQKNFTVIEKPGGLFEATIRIYNKGSIPIPRFRVNFYAGDPDKGGRLLSPQAAGPIMPGDNWGEYNPRLRLRPDENTISVVVDPDNRVEELDETNNKATRKISATVKVKSDSDSDTHPKYKTESTKIDIAIDDKNLMVRKQPDGLFVAVIRIYNKSSMPLPQFGVNFYAGDPNKGGRLLATHAAGPIMPGGSWAEGNPRLKLKPGENTISVVVDPGNKIEESDETNNKASQTISITVKVKPAESKVLAGMVGTWFFDNPRGDEEQMAVFPNGRVVVLYSNGHKDQTNIVNGFIELAEYNNIKCRMAVREDDILVQYFGRSESLVKRWRRISLEPHTNLLRSLTESSEDIGKFSVTLSNGLTVDLIGVCEHPSKDKQWWRPDGSSLSKAPYESRGGQPIENSNEEKNRLVEFAISFAGSQLPYTDVCYQVPGATRTSGGGDVQPTPKGAIKSIACEISKSRYTAEVRLGVATGQWKTITEYDGGRGGFVGPNDIVFSDPIETKRGTAIAVRGEWGSEGARRITAVDKNGKTHTGGWWGRSTGLKTLATTKFYNVKPEQIQKFQLQFRPYEWVEFKNVSLRSGYTTEVEF